MQLPWPTEAGRGPGGLTVVLDEEALGRGLSKLGYNDCVCLAIFPPLGSSTSAVSRLRFLGAGVSLAFRNCGAGDTDCGERSRRLGRDGLLGTDRSLGILDTDRRTERVLRERLRCRLCVGLRSDFRSLLFQTETGAAFARSCKALALL